MSTGQDSLLQDHNNDLISQSSKKEKKECKTVWLGCSWSWPRWHHLDPVCPGRYAELVRSSVPPPGTSPGSDRAEPGCSAAWLRLGGLFPEPGRWWDTNVHETSASTPSAMEDSFLFSVKQITSVACKNKDEYHVYNVFIFYLYIYKNKINKRNQQMYWSLNSITNIFLTFSLISRALLQSGSASLYFPLFP